VVQAVGGRQVVEVGSVGGTELVQDVGASAQPHREVGTVLGR